MATFTDKPWDGSASKYKDAAAYCAACLVDENEPGQPKIEDKCHLPVKEPDGTYNKNAIRNALARIGQGKFGGKAKALDRLHSLARMAGIGDN